MAEAESLVRVAAIEAILSEVEFTIVISPHAAVVGDVSVIIVVVELDEPNPDSAVVLVARAFYSNLVFGFLAQCQFGIVTVTVTVVVVMLD